ncbi:hypothetical protein FDB55_01970 [Clostridium botulinum]|uniref:hypothetical protein n=1 Tax=Clostridium botulinum TaxID=1491 RepID=UPI0013F0A37D|nr:hypothetical protein [Clostridium botulinum]MCS6110974.1 hypothetical protein [Clostridium botulinum]NFE10709.1 hypothetical protein [Clostridium botulinum]NFL42248.1 hypothetical protein [Clostridium botulinum]NFN20519.1 hypothetical protein [Clostridium botulinum]NFN41267.1 hypothetical protein [Clostridium botulinum]
MIRRKRKRVEWIIHRKRYKRYIYWIKKHKNKKKNKKKKKSSKSLSKFLDENKFKKKVKIHSKRRNKVRIPKIFSFIDNTEETIEVLRDIYYLGCNNRAEEIFIDYTGIETLDICASTVMDTIIMEIIRKRKKNKQNIGISGQYNGKNHKIKAILEVSGLVKHLGFQIEMPQNIEKLDLIESKESDIVSTNVVEYIDKCLERQHFELTKKGKKFFSLLVGEVIDNCKLHGGECCKWYTLGHYFNEENQGECQLVIFNYGKSIYESLKDKNTTCETKKSLEEMNKSHKVYYSNSLWNEEAMWTLYALQDGVSRKRDKEHPDRGTGTARFIDSFQKIGYTSKGKFPKMSIISGNTCILFNDKYKLKDVDFNGESRKIIAFNEENNLYKPPDKNNIKIIKNRFPGTVISMKFYVDEKYIEKLIKEDENENDKFGSMCKTRK